MMGNSSTNHTKRRKLRKRLEAQGLAPDVIASRILALKIADEGDSRRSERAARRRESKAVRDEIDRQWETQRQRDIAEAARRREQTEAEVYARLNPDDTGYKPTAPDPLLTGVARVNGATARAARGRRTYTKWQLDEQETRSVTTRKVDSGDN